MPAKVSIRLTAAGMVLFGIVAGFLTWFTLRPRSPWRVVFWIALPLWVPVALGALSVVRFAQGRHGPGRAAALIGGGVGLLATFVAAQVIWALQAGFPYLGTTLTILGATLVAGAVLMLVGGAWDRRRTDASGEGS